MGAFFRGSLKDGVNLTGDLSMGLAAHSGLLNTANMSYASTTIGGGVAGAVLGGINGGISDDGTVMGGAFRGAGSGAMIGAAGRFGAKRYAIGAADKSVGTASFDAAKGYADTWGANYTKGVTDSPFAFSNIMTGAFRPTN